MSDPNRTRELVPVMVEARARFLELVAELRPELHRYCARMAGNVFDGEDIVQDTLAKAHFALSEMGEPPPLRGWLFCIAHNTAMDFLRRYERKHIELVADVPDTGVSEDAGPDAALVEAALSVFVALPPVQRSAIILKDTLGHSLQETAEAMGTTVLAVKAALVRARANIAAQAPIALSNAKHAANVIDESGRKGAAPAATPTISIEERANLQRYAALFNARDWDGLRALMSAEARIDLVSRWQRRGSETREYYTRYAEVTATENLQAHAGFVDGLPVIAVYRPGAVLPSYFIRLTWEQGTLQKIRDFYFVPYLTHEARFTCA